MTDKLKSGPKLKRHSIRNSAYDNCHEKFDLKAISNVY